MKFALCVQPKIDEIGYVVRAENLGFDSAWFGDSPLVSADTYACLALGAQQTRQIRPGSGVSVAGIRLATTTASSIATINRLAPGRTCLALGTGNTGWRMLGHRALGMTQFEGYVRVVAGMLRGEEPDFEYGGRRTKVGLQMAELGFHDLAHPIPVIVSAFGPRAMAVAGRTLTGSSAQRVTGHASPCRAPPALRVARSTSRSSRWCVWSTSSCSDWASRPRPIEFAGWLGQRCSARGVSRTKLA